MFVIRIRQFGYTWTYPSCECKYTKLHYDFINVIHTTNIKRSETKPCISRRISWISYLSLWIWYHMSKVWCRNHKMSKSLSSIVKTLWHYQQMCQEIKNVCSEIKKFCTNGPDQFNTCLYSTKDILWRDYCHYSDNNGIIELFLLSCFTRDKCISIALYGMALIIHE